MYLFLPLPGLQHDWRGTSTDRRTNPTLSRRTGTAAYPGSLLKHCSLLFHVWGSFSQQLAVENPAPLEKQGWKGALRYGDGQHSKKVCSPPWSSPEVLLLAPSYANSHFQIRWPRHRRGKMRHFQPGLPLATLAAEINSLLAAS